MKQSRGFTLLEILLVLVLISVSTVAVIATFPVSQKDEAKLAAQSLFQRIQLINEEAILSGRDFGLRVDDLNRAFLFVELSEDGWKTLEKRQFGSELKLPSELVIDFQLGGNAWVRMSECLIRNLCLIKEMFA